MALTMAMGHQVNAMCLWQIRIERNRPWCWSWLAAMVCWRDLLWPSTDILHPVNSSPLTTPCPLTPLQFPNHSSVHPTSKGWVGGCGGLVGAWGVEITFAYCSRRPNLGPLWVHHTQPLQFINVTNTNTSSTDAQWMRNLTNKPHNKKGTFFNLTHMSDYDMKPCLCLCPCL